MAMAGSAARTGALAAPAVPVLRASLDAIALPLPPPWPLHDLIDFASDPWPSILNSAKDLVKKMLRQDPKERLTATAILKLEELEGAELESQLLEHVPTSNQLTLFHRK